MHALFGAPKRLRPSRPSTGELGRLRGVEGRRTSGGATSPSPACYRHRCLAYRVCEVAPRRAHGPFLSEDARPVLHHASAQPSRRGSEPARQYVAVTPDDLDATRPFEVADRNDGVAALGELESQVLGEPAFKGQRVGAVVRIVGILARPHRGPARHLDGLLRVEAKIDIAVATWKLTWT